MRFSSTFFFLCRNIIKSSEKIFRHFWRSFDSPPGGSYFIQEIYRKCIGYSEIFEKSTFSGHFNSNSFSQIDFCHGHGMVQYPHKAFYPDPCCLAFLRGVKSAKNAHIGQICPFCPSSNMPNNMDLGKMLYKGIETQYGHDKNRFEKKNWS